MAGLQVLHRFPDELRDCPATELYRHLDGPALIHLEGAQKQPIFVSVLLHGNETTGWKAIQGLMEKYRNKNLPRSLSIFIGNVSAARHGARRLNGQLDYNRVWPTATNRGDAEEFRLASQVFEMMRERHVFLSIDIHNNTGLNPHYACINRLENSFFHIARLFSSIMVHFTYPDGVQTAAFAQICPAVTIECGQVGFQHGISHALEFLESCLGLNSIPEHIIPHEDLDLFENFATVRIAEGLNFNFENPLEEQNTDINFFPELDRYNFTEVPTGTAFARVYTEQRPLLYVTSNEGENITDEFFEVSDGLLKTTRRLRPSMFTTDIDVIKKDCLCYLMGSVLT